MSPIDNLKQGFASKNIILGFDQVLRDVPIPILLCDEKGIILYTNSLFQKKFPAISENSPSILEGNIFNLHDLSGKLLEPDELEFRNSIIQKQEIKSLKYYRDHTTTAGYSISSRIHTSEESEQLIFQFTFLRFKNSKNKGVKKGTLSAIVNSSSDAIISKDLEGTITSWNRGAEKIFGYAEKEILGKNIGILIPEARRQEERIIMDTIKSGRSLLNFETSRLRKNGQEIPLSLTVSPIKDEFGTIIGASKVSRDVSDRLINEEKQARLSAIVESSDDAIISKNLNGTINSWNSGAERLFGYTEAEILGKSITLLIPKNRLGEEKEILKKIQAGKRISHFETVRLTKQGEEVPVSVSLSPLKNSQGKITGASKIVRNIEEQIKSQEKIKSYVEKLRILNSIGKDISSKLDLETVLQKVTDATTELSGAKFGAFFYNQETEGGESMMLYTLSGAPKDMFEKFGMPRHTPVFQPTFSGQGVVRVADIKTDKRYAQNAPHKGMPQGHLDVSSYMPVPVISNSGVVIGGLIFGHPEKGVFQKEHEVMVRNIAAQAAVALDNSQLFERVKSLSEKKDEFIALASHELKTPLTTIKGYLQILEKKIEEPMSKRFLTKTLDQANRLNTLIDDLLNMSRIEAGKLEFNYQNFDIRDMLMDMSETFDYSESTHQLITELGDEPVIVFGDSQRIEQVVNNLLSNAVKYSPLAETVYLKLTTEGNKASVCVQDEGLGLTPEQQQKVFSRFYRAESTKGINGLGLGLYLTKQIIDGHHGELNVKSEVGKGSEFFFSLPLGR